MLSKVTLHHEGTYRARNAHEAVAMWYAEAAARFVIVAAVSVAAAS